MLTGVIYQVLGELSEQKVSAAQVKKPKYHVVFDLDETCLSIVGRGFHADRKPPEFRFVQGLETLEIEIEPGGSKIKYIVHPFMVPMLAYFIHIGAKISFFSRAGEYRNYQVAQWLLQKALTPGEYRAILDDGVVDVYSLYVDVESSPRACKYKHELYKITLSANNYRYNPYALPIQTKIKSFKGNYSQSASVARLFDEHNLNKKNMRVLIGDPQEQDWLIWFDDNLKNVFKEHKRNLLFVPEADQYDFYLAKNAKDTGDQNVDAIKRVNHLAAAFGLFLTAAEMPGAITNNLYMLQHDGSGKMLGEWELYSDEYYLKGFAKLQSLSSATQWCGSQAAQDYFAALTSKLQKSRVI